MKKDILICGVGGQGTVLASKIIAASAMDEGSAVHSAETIGMSQKQSWTNVSKPPETRRIIPPRRAAAGARQ